MTFVTYRVEFNTTRKKGRKMVPCTQYLRFGQGMVEEYALKQALEYANRLEEVGKTGIRVIREESRQCGHYRTSPWHTEESEVTR